MLWFDSDWLFGATLPPLAAALLIAFRLLLAVLVTLHVLRTKRDVAAAIGWIGLGWLAPMVGATVYFVLGINRVGRRARRLRDRLPDDGDDTVPAAAAERDDHLAPLEYAGRRITRRRALGGNRLDILSNGDAAYPEMLAAIAAAKASIGLSSYIFLDDAAGGWFIDALIDASARGVAVRVLVDGIGSGYFRSPAYHRLRRAQVPAARFMHSTLPWRMPFLNLRTHKKILVVDGRLGFTGGMNISAANLLATNPKDPVRDTHFRIEGPVAAQLTEAFVRDWQFATDEDLAGDAWFPASKDAGELVARVVTSGPDDDLESIEFLILQAVSCARVSVRVMTPYFLPEERLVTALALASMRGVAVDVTIPRRGDHPTVDWAVDAHVGPLLKAGVRIWRNPPPFEHTKLMVVDDVWCFIGSANWDTRSFRLNFELNVEVYDAGLAAKLTAIMSGGGGERLTQTALNQRSAARKLRDAAVRLLLPYL